MSAPVVQDGGELIEAHLLGDATGFARLDALYRPRLLRFVDRMVRDPARAEDLVQETLLRVHRNGDRYNPARKFSTWIYTIAGNLARNDLRRHRRSPFVPWESAGDSGHPLNRGDTAPDPGPLPDEQEVTRSTMDLIERMIARMAQLHRRVFVLRELEGMTYEEIAEIVECDLGTVKSRLNRARRSFARLLAPYLD